MGTNPEHVPDAPVAHSEPVRWIGRDRLGFDRLTPDSPVHPTSPHTGPIEALQAGLRRKWLLPAGAVLLALAISAVLWSTLHSKPKLVPLADQRNVPLISVMTPGLKAVTSSVTFTGAIAARYDMPIGNDGETGRIVAVYVEPGDHVQRGQPLAKLDQSVLIPQVNRLAAALEQAQAQAALSAAEYRRAQGVESAGALSAEDIEKRRATAVTDAANVKVAAIVRASSRPSPARSSRAGQKSARSPIRAARRCFGSRAAVRSRCAASSRSRISPRSRSVTRRACT